MAQDARGNAKAGLLTDKIMDIILRMLPGCVRHSDQQCEDLTKANPNSAIKELQ